MKRALMPIGIILAVMLLLSGCATMYPCGVFYTEVQVPNGVTSNTGYSKTGTAMATSVLGLVATGDASIATAAKNGGITRIHHVDYSAKNILGIYGEYTTTVYGD